MKVGYSIRTRLLLGAALVLLAFLTGAGLAVQRANTESVRAAYFGRLQSTIYLLLAAAELDARGALVMPQAFAEPRLALPGSGLYAGIYNVLREDQWQSASSLGLQLPLRRSLEPGQWLNDTVEGAGKSFLSVSYAVTWKAAALEAPLVLTVLELTAFEYRLLEYLVRQRPAIVSRQVLSDYLYPHGEDRDSNVLEVLVGRLRRKLDPGGHLNPIDTERGRGYRFTLA